MRLREKDKLGILRGIAQALPGPYRVYLFGSRTRDDDRGGDIDLLILLGQGGAKADEVKKSSIVGAIHKEIGERKIDIVVDSEPPTSSFVIEILPKAILLGP